MTGLDIFISFVISYIAGNIPSLKQVLTGGDDLSIQDKIDHCYQKALEKWCANDALRQRMANQKFSNKEELAEVAAKSNDEDAVAILTLAKLWSEELRKDEVCAHFIQEQAIQEVGDKVDKIISLIEGSNSGDFIKKSKGLREHLPVQNYIRRYCSTENSADSFVYYALDIRKRHCLADYVTGIVGETNKYILYSSAQTGKTTELKELCWELQESGLYLPIIYEVRNNTKLKREELPDTRFVNEKETVVVIDALDEVNGLKYDDLLEEIRGYAYDHPKIKMVLSCRSNFRREKQLDLFADLFLEELSYGDAKTHIENNLGKGSGLIGYINESQVAEFIRNPFFLNVLIQAYKDDSTRMPKTKAEIYRLFIEKSYNEEKDSKTVPVVKRHTFDEAVVLLERVALGLSLMNVQTLSEDELLICLDGRPENVAECLRYDLIRCEEGRYSFQHNAFREWLVANYLKREGHERAKLLATQPNGRIKAEWYNIIMLWVSMYGLTEKDQIPAIIGWLRSASLDLIVYIDKGMLTEETRNNVFKGLLLEYKALGIRMANILSQDYKDLLRFGQSEDTVQFIIDELQDAEIGTAYYSDLMCLCYFLEWDKLELASEELTEKLVNTLVKKTKEALNGKLNHDLSFLYMDSPFFAQKKYLERFFAVVEPSNHYEAIKSIIRLIGETDVVDEYIDYILEKEKFVCNQQEGITTQIVSRTAVYEALCRVKTIDSVLKILRHDFRNLHTSYHDEWEEYSKMMKNCLAILSDRIVKGRYELIGELEAYYEKTFKDYHYHFDRDEHAQELLASIRESYLKAGLRDKGKKEFEDKVHRIFDLQEEHNRLDIEQVFRNAALWMTEDDVKEYFDHLDVNNLNDRFKASWLDEVPYKPVSGYANVLFKERFPELPDTSKRRERQKASFNDLADYSVFKQTVLEMVGGLDKFANRKEHWNYLRQIEDGYNQYAYRFMMLYADSNDNYDAAGIIKGIRDKEVYGGFFMREIEGQMSRPNPDLEVTEEYKNRCLETAKKTVEKLGRGEQPVYFAEDALELLLKGFFEVTQDVLLGLLNYAGFNISKKDEYDYYSREYSLFEYVTERIDVDALAPIVVKKLKENLGTENSQTPYHFADYIVKNHIEEGYIYTLRFALSNNSLAANIQEDLIKNRILVEEIKAATRKMKVSVRLFTYSSIIRNTGDADWVRQELEPEYRTYSGYELRKAVRILVGIGSLDALDFLVSQPELMRDGEDYYFNYDQTNAIPSLCYFIKYCQDEKLDGIHTLTTILNSLEKIALKNKESLAEVKQYLRELTKKGEQYKYLNRYVLTFEDKFYAACPGISDIHDVMSLITGGVSGTGGNQERVEVKENPDQEPIYISYCWEGESQHTVDYLCFVLDTQHIPYKRDTKDCHYTDNIKAFMDMIRAGRKVVVVLSRSYLHSKNCMYEFTGILESSEYKKLILPVVVDDTIRSSLFYADLVGFWKEKLDEQEEVVKRLKAIDPNKAKPEKVKLNEIQTIYDKLDEIKEFIDWTNAENLDSLCATQFRSIIEIVIKRV